ncbi:MAG: hypothetical protein ACQEXJ_21620, partial [Myxococcota bacterium]
HHPIKHHARPASRVSGALRARSTEAATILTPGEGELEGSATVETGFDAQSDTRAGAIYEDGSWQQVWDPALTGNAHPPTWQAQGASRLRVYVRPELELSLYASAGSTLGLVPYLEWQGYGAALPPSWKLLGGLAGTLDFDLTILSWSLAHYSTELFDWNTLLAEGPDDTCVPTCADRECGPDPACGESCGTCPAGGECVDGACEQAGPHGPGAPGEFLRTFAVYMRQGFDDSALASCHPNFRSRYRRLIEVLPPDVLKLLADALENGTVADNDGRFARIGTTLDLPDGTTSTDELVLMAVEGQWRLLSW